MLLPTHSTLPDIATSGHPASTIVNTPAGNIAATTVQAAINELDSEKISGAGTVTDNALVRFDGTTGNALQNSSGATLSDNFALTLAGSAVTASEPLLNLSQTWNNSGVTFSGIKMVVTDTASANSSLFIDLKSGSDNLLSLTKGGYLTIGSIAQVNGIQLHTGDGSYKAVIKGKNYCQIALDTESVSFGGFGISTEIGRNVCWRNSALGWDSSDGLGDVFLRRDGADSLALRNSTNAQTFNIYNTYTDAANYERGYLRWNSNVLEIGTEAAGTGTKRELKLNTGALTLSLRSDRNIRIENASGYWVFGSETGLILSPNFWTVIGASGANSTLGFLFTNNTIQLGRNSGNFSFTHDPILTDVAPRTFIIYGASAYVSAVTNITGSYVALQGGAGAGNSSGAAHGGNIYLRGGQGYGTGHNGYVYIGDSLTAGVSFFNATPSAQIAHVADASTAHAITDPADAPADADALREDLVSNVIPSLETALNSLGTKINTILTTLESFGFHAAS